MTVRAGFGSGVIPTVPPVRLAGFGARTDPATGVHDDLEAHAVYLSDEDAGLCLVVCDLLGMTADVADPVRDAIADELGLERDAVLTACTHTHSAPSALRGSEALGWVTPDGFADDILAACLEAARRASARATSAQLRYSRAPLPQGLSVNRRGYEHEPWLSVLEAVAEDGRRIGAVANLAVHPVTLGPGWLEVSADWPGAFRRAMGGNALVLSGALGDVNPWPAPGPDEERWPRAESLGTAIAQAVNAALDQAAPVAGPLRVASSRRIEVPVSGALVALAGAGDRMSVELIEWDVGDVRLVSLPGEAFESFGRAVEGSRGARTMLAGLSPVWQGYLPRPFADGYEEGVSFGEAAVAGIFDALVPNYA